MSRCEVLGVHSVNTRLRLSEHASPRGGSAGGPWLWWCGGVLNGDCDTLALLAQLVGI
jgi:hypothetical protein